MATGKRHRRVCEAIGPTEETVPYTVVVDPLGVITAWSPGLDLADLGVVHGGARPELLVEITTIWAGVELEELLLDELTAAELLAGDRRPPPRRRSRPEAGSAAPRRTNLTPDVLEELEDALDRCPPAGRH